MPSTPKTRSHRKANNQSQQKKPKSQQKKPNAEIEQIEQEIIKLLREMQANAEASRCPTPRMQHTAPILPPEASKADQQNPMSSRSLPLPVETKAAPPAPSLSTSEKDRASSTWPIIDFKKLNSLCSPSWKCNTRKKPESTSAPLSVPTNLNLLPSSATAVKPNGQQCSIPAAGTAPETRASASEGQSALGAFFKEADSAFVNTHILKRPHHEEPPQRLIATVKSLEIATVKSQEIATVKSQEIATVKSLELAPSREPIPRQCKRKATAPTGTPTGTPTESFFPRRNIPDDNNAKVATIWEREEKLAADPANNTEREAARRCLFS